jgi:hypothetical protein
MDLEDTGNAKRLRLDTDGGSQCAWRTAEYLLQLKTQAGLTQSSIGTVVDATGHLISSLLGQIKTNIMQKLDGDISHLENVLDECCSDYKDCFSKLETVFQQEKFFRDNFHLVEPLPVILCNASQSAESFLTWQRQKGIRQPVEKLPTGDYVPFLKNVEQLLNSNIVLSDVMKGHISTDGIMRDICDGNYCKSHALFGQDHTALQVIAYYDDVEVVNPLGSKRKKHKVGCFYYVLANLLPARRSVIEAVQLIAVAKTKDIRSYGVGFLLQPFLDEINVLSTGHTFIIHGEEQRLSGSVVAFCGDTPASNFLGGFKEGVGGALRMCRRCMASNVDIQNKFSEHKLSMRDEDTHEQHCQQIEDPDLRTHLSVNYGVNSWSVLRKINNFKVTECLPFDIMHVLLEGVVTKEIRLLLQHCLHLKYFSLTNLNKRIRDIDLGHNESRNRPIPIAKVTIDRDDKLGQRAAQAWCLAVNLPILIGQFVPSDDEHYYCFLTLLAILAICVATSVTAEDACLLATMTEDHHHRFCNLYPDQPVTPKMHYMVHLPSQLLSFGPLRTMWCMRFEAKNGHFKRLVKGNFKNIALSLAKQSQLYMCHRLLSSQDGSSSYLSKEDIVLSGNSSTKGKTVDFTNHPLAEQLLQTLGLNHQRALWVFRYTLPFLYLMFCKSVTKVDACAIVLLVL